MPARESTFVENPFDLADAIASGIKNPVQLVSTALHTTLTAAYTFSDAGLTAEGTRALVDGYLSTKGTVITSLIGAGSSGFMEYLVYGYHLKGALLNLPFFNSPERYLVRSLIIHTIDKNPEKKNNLFYKSFKAYYHRLAYLKSIYRPTNSEIEELEKLEKKLKKAELELARYLVWNDKNAISKKFYTEIDNFFGSYQSFVRLRWWTFWTFIAANTAVAPFTLNTSFVLSKALLGFLGLSSITPPGILVALAILGVVIGSLLMYNTFIELFYKDAFFSCLRKIQKEFKESSSARKLLIIGSSILFMGILAVLWLSIWGTWGEMSYKGLIAIYKMSQSLLKFLFLPLFIVLVLINWTFYLNSMLATIEEFGNCKIADMAAISFDGSKLKQLIVSPFEDFINKIKSFGWYNALVIPPILLIFCAFSKLLFNLMITAWKPIALLLHICFDGLGVDRAAGGIPVEVAAGNGVLTEFLFNLGFMFEKQKESIDWNEEEISHELLECNGEYHPADVLIAVILSPLMFLCYLIEGWLDGKDFRGGFNYMAEKIISAARGEYFELKTAKTHKNTPKAVENDNENTYYDFFNDTQPASSDKLKKNPSPGLFDFFAQQRNKYIQHAGTQLCFAQMR